MSRFPNGTRRVTSAMLSVLVVAQTTGCTPSSWRPVTAPSPTEVAREPNAEYRITTKAQRVVYLEQVRYRHDSILGTRNDVTVGLPIAEVASIDKTAAGAGNNLTAVLALAAVGLLVSAIVSVQNIFK